MSLSEHPAPLGRPVTICVLLYGDHADLAARVLGSLLANTPRGSFKLRLGLNAVGAETDRTLETLLPRFEVEKVVRSEINLFKGPMMRLMTRSPFITTPWMIWFDDDSHARRPDWLQMLCCESRLRPEVGMWGAKFFVRAEERHARFMREAPWHRGVALEPDDRSPFGRISFITGGFWALRARWLERLDWPDPRLLMEGEDFMLGEALRQNGAILGSAFSGVAVNDSKRRWTETPQPT